MRRHTDVQIEAFIHGAMCIGYSGRCVLSNHMSMVIVVAAHRTVAGSDLFEMSGGENNHNWKMVKLFNECRRYGDDRTHSDLVEAGVNSFKIEGRMKSIHYVSTVANVYRQAVDAIVRPRHYVLKREWVDELWKVAQREMSTGFYYGTPTADDELFGKRKRPQYGFVGEF